MYPVVVVRVKILEQVLESSFSSGKADKMTPEKFDLLGRYGTDLVMRIARATPAMVIRRLDSPKI